MNWNAIIDELNRNLKQIKFKPPVSYVYNPLEYARKPYELYLEKYASNRKEAVFLGMNPGPWGMAQTGIPFGEISTVKSWLQIEAFVGLPEKVHPKKPVLGFNCTRSEISGKRLWGWIKKKFSNPEVFFSRFFVINYCPLLFLDENGKNITPVQLSKDDRIKLIKNCDKALFQAVEYLMPRYLIGVGIFARQRIEDLFNGDDRYQIGGITHPSPANPRSNKGWEELVEKELEQLGVFF